MSLVRFPVTPQNKRDATAPLLFYGIFYFATRKLYVVIMSLFGPVVGVSLSLMAVRYTDAGIASTLMALTPVLILIPAAVFDKQKIRFKEILGVTISMIGVALFFLL